MHSQTLLATRVAPVPIPAAQDLMAAPRQR